MNAGKQQRLYRILNPNDGRAVCVAADHGWMSDFTPNVAELRRIVGQVVEGGADAILLSLGQAMRLGELLKGRHTPALLVRADWMNMPRLGGSNVANAIPQQELRHLAIATAQDALDLGASAITIYLFLGFDDETEARNLATCAAFAQECRRIGLVCIIEPLAVGASVTGANIVDVLITGARMAVEVGADMLKIPFTGDVESFRRLVQAAEVPVLALGGARSERETDALELVAEALEAGLHFLLEAYSLVEADYPNRGVSALWRRLNFPLFYQVDVLFALRVAALLGALDRPGAQRSLAWLAGWRDRQGRWHGASPFRGRTIREVAPDREETDRWVSLFAADVLQQAEGTGVAGGDQLGRRYSATAAR